MTPIVKKRIVPRYFMNGKGYATLTQAFRYHVKLELRKSITRRAYAIANETREMHPDWDNEVCNRNGWITAYGERFPHSWRGFDADARQRYIQDEAEKLCEQWMKENS